jgi:hypothetical protein
VTGNETACKMGIFLCLVKSSNTSSVEYSLITHQRVRINTLKPALLALLLALKPAISLFSSLIS